ncbi:PrgI family protein [Candidatus Saccharibacteria bacterium]|nr:PrgI family protein [Candidatus Saccharibacteria bacterium]
MGQYSVPQNVEAEDKLLGPFSFRQFIYLVIVAGCVALAWALGTLFIGLAIIPLPVIVLFGALALPLKKDQPMETYLLAIVSFFLKPRKRIWQADGIESQIEITAPKVEEVQYTKDISENEANKRLTYLSNLADSQGWAIKTGGSSPMRDDLYQEAMSTTDVLDENSQMANNLSQLMDNTDQKRRDDVIKSMRDSFAQEDASTGVQPAAATPDLAAITEAAEAPPQITSFYKPVPEPVAPAAAPSQVAAAPDIIKDEDQDNGISPDIVNLANNNDLSVETIARQAEKATKKDEGEVFVSLR